MDTTYLRPKGMTLLDEEINAVVEVLRLMKPTDKEYVTVANNLKLLCEAREKKNDRTLSYDALLAAGTTLIGMLLVLNFERAGVITSRAFSFLRLGQK